MGVFVEVWLLVPKFGHRKLATMGDLPTSFKELLDTGFEMHGGFGLA